MSKSDTKSGWKEKRLDEVCSLVTDGTHDSPKLQSHGMPFIKGTHISEGMIDFENCDYITREEHEKCIARSHPERGDILFSNIGSVGDCAFINSDVEFSIKNVALFKPDHNQIDPRFLYYTVISPFFRGSLLGKKSGSAQPFLSLGTLRSHPVLLPENLEVQRHISSILGLFDDLIDNNNKRIKILEKIARLIYREWFIYYQFPNHEMVKKMDSRTELGEIPQGWKIIRLDQVCESIMSGGTPRTSSPEYWGGNISWLSSGETRNNFIIETEKTITDEGVSESSTRLARSGCTVIASAGQGKTRGQTSMLRIDSYINQSVIALTANRKLITDNFLFYDLERRYNQYRQISDGSTRGSLTTKLLADLTVVMPSPELIGQFDSIVEPMVRSIELMLRKNNILRRTRDLLLPKLISGQLAVY